MWNFGLINIYSFNQQGNPYIKVSGWQCIYYGAYMYTYVYSDCILQVRVT